MVINHNFQKIYASLAQMSDNDEIPSRDFDDSSKLTNWILDSGEKCNMTTQVSYFIPGLLEDVDENIEVVDGHHVTVMAYTSQPYAEAMDMRPSVQ